MQDQPNDLLLLAGRILTIIIQIGIAIGFVAILIAGPVSLFHMDEMTVKFAERAGDVSGRTMVFTVLGLMAIALPLLAMAYVFFGKLRAIIATVGHGDPFIPENADRLSLMAWLLLGVQILLIPAMGMGLMLAKLDDSDAHADITIDAGLDPEGILMVIVLFILARVFKHGAAMRADLEGTV